MTVTRESDAATSTSTPAATPRQRKAKDRGAKFNEKHALKYGLSICSRNAKDNSVEMVMCKFCVAFGKESLSDATRKRRATANIKYFRQPFRADHYVSHLEINHKVKWAEYERAEGAEKEKFFSFHLEEGVAPPPPPSIASMPLTTAPMDDAAMEAVRAEVADNAGVAGVPGSSTPMDPLTLQRFVGPVRIPVSEIEKELVERVIGDLFFDAKEERGVTMTQALSMFTTKENTRNFEITIKNQRLYDLAIRFVSCGASYRLASKLIQCTKEETHIGFYGGCSDQRVANYIRAVMASNLQRVAWMMRGSWTYAIATEAAEHQGTSYLDVRIRVWHNGGLRDFHLMTLPAFDRHPATTIMQRLERLLTVLDPRWRSKLLGTTANGGANTGRNLGVTGSQQGLAARLTGLVTRPGFYLIWSGIQQLELVAKNCVVAFCDRAFFDDLLVTVNIIRKEKHGSFRADDLPDLASTLPTARGFVRALLKVLKRLMENHATVTQVMTHFGGATQLSPSWWVCVAVAYRLIAEVDYFMKKLLSMQSGPQLVNDQVQELCKLALIMADVVGARRDLWDARDVTDACTAGSFLLTFLNAQQFIQNEGGQLAIEMFDSLRGVDRTLISKAVAHFAVDLVASVAAITQDGRHYCADSSGIVVNPPAVLPYAVYKMGKDEFLKLLQSQEHRLHETYTAEEIRRIQGDYYYFQVAVETETILSNVLKKHTRETDVSFAWSCLNNRFMMLQEFIGGLSCVVPDASAGSLSSDLLNLNWEKPDYRDSLVDFALDGILHARQKMKIEVVDVNYLRALLRPADHERAQFEAARSRLMVPIDTATPAGGPAASPPTAEVEETTDDAQEDENMEEDTSRRSKNGNTQEIEAEEKEDLRETSVV
ncbi:hypothetical protein Poli38472_006736 [Pythium oligandrum]|uniref:Uncharacterized protein n=1 Tax=Pythium oligandrum TaxID=41045 RepID=A0A8K1C5B7_PYTOL|nr:hypothetical protein Poli38472_006736 [Pythium oligandrum]|eukprot:TMW56726.1 hypothetical protein Poli38472_006736 [Pythium oligandrum]